MYSDEFLIEEEGIKIVSENNVVKCYFQDILLSEIDNENKITKVYPRITYNGSSGKPKYAIETFIFEGYSVEVEPSQSGEFNVLSGLPEVFIKTLRYGLGLQKAYRFIVDIPKIYCKECDTIVASKHKRTEIKDNQFIINNNDLDKIRRGIDNTHSLFLREARKTKELFVYNELLHNINPTMYPEKKKETQKEVIYKIIKDTDFNKSISKSDKDVLSDIKDNVDLSYLQILKSEFERLIAENHKENKFQKFFEDNPLLLTLFSGTSYFQFNNQAYIGGKSFDNTSGQYPDFLYRHKITNNTFIIEIKTPKTPLLEKNAYREGVYNVSKELSGAISQLLNQKHILQQNFSSLLANAKDRNVETYDVQGLVILGSLSEIEDDKNKQRSFELFRNNLKNLRVITYDECLEQLKSFVDFLSLKMTTNSK
jgi:hypothetical protein